MLSVVLARGMFNESLNDRKPRLIRGIKWVTSEAIKIAEKRMIEGQVALLHTAALNKGVLNTGEVTKRGGRRTKI